MSGRVSTHPIATVVALEIVAVAAVAVAGWGLAVLFPGLPGYSVSSASRSLFLVLGAAVALLVAVGALRRWDAAGFTRPSRWRALGLYWLPVALLAAPFVAGVRLPPLSAIGLLAVAYLATGVYEEGLWRGVMLGILRPLGAGRAVIISSVLFGLGHLGNAMLRGGMSPMIAAQAFGAAVGGVGYAALRLRTNTIWPLIVIHALHDLFLQFGRLPIPLVEVPIDTVLLVYGIVLLRRRRSGAEVAPGVSVPASPGTTG